MDDEIRKHQPKYENYLEIFRTIGNLRFSLADFDTARATRPDVDLEGKASRAILAQLFEFSVVGFYRAGGAGFGGSGYIWRHKDRQIRFNEEALSFQIHPGFTEVLALKRWQKSANHRDDGLNTDEIEESEP